MKILSCEEVVNLFDFTWDYCTNLSEFFSESSLVYKDGVLVGIEIDAVRAFCRCFIWWYHDDDSMRKMFEYSLELLEELVREKDKNKEIRVVEQ